ncbi:30S ribosomal protein S12 [bacterium]|nr:MAG: 30S ribosomal protein S12 [bacterium]
MATYQQLIKKIRKTKEFRSSTPHFKGAPHKNGVCLRVGTVKPKKPNSAQRKIAKVCLTNQKNLTAYIPGRGHQLQKHSLVMVRGGRVPDLPGCRYHLIRRKLDFKTRESFNRKNRRSKYSVKRIEMSMA